MKIIKTKNKLKIHFWIKYTQNVYENLEITKETVSNSLSLKKKITIYISC